MDVSNLRSNYPKLLSYLTDNGYGKAHKGWIKRCINLVLTDGASNEIESYEQLYWFEVEKCGYIKECELVGTDPVSSYEITICFTFKYRWKEKSVS